MVCQNTLWPAGILSPWSLQIPAGLLKSPKQVNTWPPGTCLHYRSPTSRPGLVGLLPEVDNIPYSHTTMLEGCCNGLLQTFLADPCYSLGLLIVQKDIILFEHGVNYKQTMTCTEVHDETPLGFRARDLFLPIMPPQV